MNSCKILTTKSRSDITRKSVTSSCIREILWSMSSCIVTVVVVVVVVVVTVVVVVVVTVVLNR